MSAHCERYDKYGINMKLSTSYLTILDWLHLFLLFLNGLTVSFVIALM